MDEKLLQAAITRGRQVANDATATRQSLRWQAKPGDETREKLIADAIESINDAMADIRSARAWVVWHPQPLDIEDALATTSATLQYERKQLKKMAR